jgi:hypothetical protein
MRRSPDTFQFKAAAGSPGPVQAAQIMTSKMMHITFGKWFNVLDSTEITHISSKSTSIHS